MGEGVTVAGEETEVCSESVQHPGADAIGGAALSATGPRITKVPPPPKHKNNSALNPRGFSGFLPLDEDDATGLSEGPDADQAGVDRSTRELADALLALSGESALEHVRRIRTLFLDEHQSALGVTEHRLAVLRRLRCGEPGAVLLDGKSYLLTEAAHGEELAMVRQIARLQAEEDA
jgi:hypothetical protein